MKIVISSLLRIGDFLMHQNVRNGIKEIFPEAEFTWILQDSNSPMHELLPEGDQCVLFPRRSLQEMARLRTLPIGAPEVIVHEWLSHLTNVKFDWALNLGHDKTSGYILSQIQADRKTGLEWDGKSWKSLDNEWLKYLNNHFSSGLKSEFHYVDVLLRMADIPFTPPTAQKNKSKTILLQPFTSDQKKNWSMQNWVQLQKWITNHTDYKAIVVGAFFEETELLKSFAVEDIWLGGLGDLQAFVSTAAFVIAGDTGIIHMAALAGIPTLTMSLGSSDPVKTSAFGQGHFVLSATSECRPCGHNDTCTKVSHLCGEDLNPEYAEKVLDYLINPARALPWKQGQKISLIETIYQNGFLRNFDHARNLPRQEATEKEGSHERRSEITFQPGS